MNGAGLLVRVKAFLYDYVVIMGYITVLVAATLLIQAIFALDQSAMMSNPLLAQLVGFVTMTLPVSLYFAISESSGWQASWGKRRANLKVQRTNGQAISIGRSILRTALKFVPWELAHTSIWMIIADPESIVATAGFVLVYVLIGANLVSVWLSPRKQALYDLLADTQVIQIQA